MRPLRLMLPLTLALSLAGAASAASMRYLSYDAASESAKWRTGDVTVSIRKGLLTRRAEVLFRRKGSDLPLHPSDAPFTEHDLRAFLGDRDPDSVRLYTVDAKAGAKFTGFACEGKADKSWLAISTPRPYRPLSIWVLRWDAAKAAPAVCVAMDYRFRGEWAFPPTPNRAAENALYQGR